jgi:phosphodiesterase/alkaline phosphatase D-like protein
VSFPWSDDFSGTLTTNWDTSTGSGWAISAGQLISAGSDIPWQKVFDRIAYGPDYYVQIRLITLSPTTGNYFIVGGRWHNNASTSINYYGAQIKREAGGNYRVAAVKRVNNGSITELAFVTNQAWASGDVLRCELQGDTITIKQNGTTIIAAAVDSAYALQDIAGTAVLRASAADWVVDDFEAGFLDGPVKNVVHTSVGHCTPTTATIVWAVSHACDVDVQWSTSPSFASVDGTSSVTTVSGLDTNDAVATGATTIAGLSPNTQYYFRIRLDGVVKHVSGALGFPSFWTALSNVAGGAAFSFAFGSCDNEAASLDQTYASLAAHAGVRLMFHLGDLAYIDTAGLEQVDNNEANFRSRYRQQLAGGNGYAEYRKPRRAFANYWTWDDHDFGVGGFLSSVAKTALKAALDAYQFRGHPSPITAGEMYYAFGWGNVGFFVLDNRTLRVAGTTAIGSIQMAALKQWLSDNNQVYRLKFVVSSTALDPYDAGDSWGSDSTGYQNEIGTGPSPNADNLLKYIHTNDIGGVVFLGGDRHYYAVTKLRNQEGLTGIYCLMSSNLNQNSQGTCAATRISSISRSSGVVTVTTSAKHNLLVGETVHISNVSDNTGTNFNGGPFTVASTPTATTFTYSDSGGADGSGTVTAPTPMASSSHAVPSQIVWRDNPSTGYYAVITVDTTIGDPALTFAIYDKTGAAVTTARPPANTADTNATLTITESQINAGLNFMWSAAGGRRRARAMMSVLLPRRGRAG